VLRDEFNNKTYSSHSDSVSYSTTVDPSKLSLEDSRHNQSGSYTRYDSLDHIGHRRDVFSTQLTGTGCPAWPPSHNDGFVTVRKETATELYSTHGIYSTQTSTSDYENAPLPSQSAPEIPWHPANLQAHGFAMSTEESPPQDKGTARFLCKSCDETFSHKSGLSRHVKSHHRENRDSMTCPIIGCKKADSQRRKDNLRDHIRRKHPLIKLEELGL
jgi:hypothetical protein